jgi:hypothetical protein
MSTRSVPTVLHAFSPPVAPMAGLLAGIIALTNVTHAVGEEVCRPALAFKEVQFSQVQPPTMERKWTAIVSVDASRCKARSAGYFEVVFSRLKENAPEIEFREEFMWMSFEWLPPSMKVEVDFSADEAVQRYWFDNITPCPCGG